MDQLRPHPSYVKHRLSPSTSQLTALSALGELIFQQPIMVTTTGIIIDGYARWELAKRLRRETIACLEYQLNEEESLRWLIHFHRPSIGMNGFCRSLLALDLKPSLQQRARSNQVIGGQRKGNSDLTEAQTIDVRSELAAVAYVSTGNLTKVEEVIADADPFIRDAAKSGEIRIHRAWQFSRLPHQHQRKKMEEFRSGKGVGVVSRRLIQRHVARMTATQLMPPTLADVVKPLVPDRIAMLEEIVLSEIDVPGRIAYLTKGAIGVLKSAEGS